MIIAVLLHAITCYMNPVWTCKKLLVLGIYSSEQIKNILGIILVLIIFLYKHNITLKSQVNVLVKASG